MSNGRADVSMRRDDYPANLANAEEALVVERRRANGSPESSGRVGVGLSGGGIRSATFCLGVFQALAKPRGGRAGELLERIDYLSTVSGGGYFGSFFGRLFSRNEIHGIADVAAVLRGAPMPPTTKSSFRFLRDNGRYLAPRGAGDLLALVAVTLRNWVAVQTVLMAIVLLAFVLLQYLDMRIRGEEVLWATRWLVLSPVFVLLVPLALFWAIPSAWAFWVVGTPLSTSDWLRRWDLALLVMLGVGWSVGWLPRFDSDAPFASTLALAALLLAVAALFTTIWSFVINVRGAIDWLRALFKRRDDNAALTHSSLARNRLTRWFKRALMAFGVVAVVAFVDSLGATAYAIFQSSEGFASFTKIAAGTLATALGGLAAFGRQLSVLFGEEGRKGHPRVPLSIISWIAAVLIVGGWLIGLNAVSHAIAWAAQKPHYADTVFPAQPSKPAEATLIEVVTLVPGRQVVRALEEPPSAVEAAPAALRDATFTAGIMTLLLAFVLVVGSTRSFLNASSLHNFYSQRLTRAYLGASNPKRLESSAHVTDMVPNDYLPSNHYWHWPQRKRPRSFVQVLGDALHVRSREGAKREAPPPSGLHSIARKGGPLHIVNVTINETLDAGTGVQRQDRKGVPMAVGPCSISVGVRHHLVTHPEHGHVTRHPESGSYVFRGEGYKADPEALSLGRWVSISGAAFSSALGARTTVPLALLSTFANIRLGYWWDSGVGKGWASTFLPSVYRGLLAESIARLRGTGDRYWNLTDGGHFENLAGYELIRRRLPLIVLIDAEADPDFEFSGLSALISKARLDFGADIRFLPEDEVPFGRPFTSLEKLRRIEREGVENPTFSTPADRRSYSRGHAALATVLYADGSAGWLVYVKASLTGHEPTDVLQYHAKHPDFPHEPTSDQFFDEAQWESYRRLGEHVGDEVFTPAVFDLALGKTGETA